MKRRLFIGLEISDEAREKIAEYSNRLRDRFREVKVGWEPAEKYHITIKFLGDLEEAEIDSITELTAFIARRFKPISLHVGEHGVFPGVKSPRILWVGIDDQGNNTRKLANDFESEFEKYGFAKEKRRFHPHITIARIREPKKASALAEAHLNEKIEPVQFNVSEIVIFESLLKSTGSIYIPLKRLPI